MTPVDVSDVVDALADQTVTRRRYAAGAYSTATGSKGVFVPGATTDTPIFVCIGPVTGRDKQDMSEGVRLRARYKLHTTADLRGDEPMTGATATQADHVLYDGREYEVIQDRRWVGHGGYRRFILAETTAEA
jgi:hypothetical protein